MRHHPARTRRTRITRYPTRYGRLSNRATMVLGIAMIIAILVAISV